MRDALKASIARGEGGCCVEMRALRGPGAPDIAGKMPAL